MKETKIEDEKRRRKKEKRQAKTERQKDRKTERQKDRKKERKKEKKREIKKDSFDQQVLASVTRRGNNGISMLIHRVEQSSLEFRSGGQKQTLSIE